jgi:hypothetical protein
MVQTTYIPGTFFYCLFLSYQVGFVAACVVDGGHTVITRAARVREDVAGRGVFSNLNRHVLAASKQNIHAITCSNLNPGTKKESFQMSHRKILAKVRWIARQRLVTLEQKNLIIRYSCNENHEIYIS